MSRNPLYTVFGLGLLAAQYLSPRAATTSVAQQREHEQLSIKFLRGVSSQRAATKAVENVVVALYAAIILALAALWVNSMSNTYAHDLDVRCGAQAMANFAAVAIRIVMLYAGLFWGGCVGLRLIAPWLQLQKWRYPNWRWLPWVPVWLWLGTGACVAIQTIFTDHMWVEHQPLDFAQTPQVACYKLLISSDPFGWMDRVAFPLGGPFGDVGQPEKR